MPDTRKPLSRLRSEWWMKVWLGTLLGVVFCTGYFTIQRFPVRPASTLPLTWIDRAIGFSPGWAWVYQSIYLIFPTAWLAQTRDELRRYAAGLLFVSAVAFACFILWPVSAPRPLDVPTTGMYGLLISYDGPINCFPSLHLGLATYAACFATSVLDGRPRRMTGIVLSIWIALIGYSTLATKQHYFIDIPAGVLLGWLGHAVTTRAFSWRARTTFPAIQAEGGRA